jgi:hypothetical protein
MVRQEFNGTEDWLSRLPDGRRRKLQDEIVRARKYVPNAVPQGDGMQSLQPLGTAALRLKAAKIIHCLGRDYALLAIPFMDDWGRGRTGFPSVSARVD